MRVRRTAAVLFTTAAFMGSMAAAPAQAQAFSFDVYDACNIANWVGVTYDGCYA